MQSRIILQAVVRALVNLPSRIICIALQNALDEAGYLQEVLSGRHIQAVGTWGVGVQNWRHAGRGIHNAVILT